MEWVAGSNRNPHVVTDGADGTVVNAVRKAAQAKGAKVKIIAPKIGGVSLNGGEKLNIDGQLAGSPSVIFDAIAIVVSAEGCTQLLQDGLAVDFVRDAFGHLKAIGFTSEAKPILDRAGVTIDAGVIDLADGVAAFIKPACNRQWARESKIRVVV